MEIYKDSGIYKGPSIYESGAGGGGGGGGYTPDFGNVSIYGKKYKTIKMPDGKTWLAENLNAEIPGIPIYTGGNYSSPAAFYKDSSYREKYGLLYNGYAVDYIQNNINFAHGFRLPTDNDFYDLLQIIGTEYTFVNTNIDENWPVTGIRNLLGFSCLPSGQYNADYQDWEAVGTAAEFSTTTFIGQYRYVWVATLTSFRHSTATTEKQERAYAIRLCKDG